MNVSTTLRIFAAAGTLLFTGGLILGCSNSVSPTTNPIVTAATASVPVLITDAPSDQLVSFSLTLNTITLTDTAGKTASILSTPTTVEICHLNGVQAPLVTASIPQDTYTSAVITFSNPQITYVSSSATPVVATPVLATTSFTFTFPTPFTVNNTSTSLLVDLLASQSVVISGTTVTVTPTFSLKPVPPATAAPPMGQNGTGMEQVGAVVSASGTTLVIQPPSGPTVTFTTNSSTALQGFTALTSLAAGELVLVDFTVSGGCNPLSNACGNLPPVLLASSIQLEPTPPNAVQPNLLTGPVTAVTAGTGFKMVVMQGFGTMVPASTAAAVLTVTTTTSTNFAITPQFVSLSGLPFTPNFTAANLNPGQTVGVVSSSIAGNTAAASTVYLVPQTLDGTVAAIKTVGNYTAYTLTLNSGSAFASLSGASTVTVYTSSATAPPPPNATGAAPPAIIVGSTVRFNGLVFNLGGGSFSMVAGVCPDGAPGI